MNSEEEQNEYKHIILNSFQKIGKLKILSNFFSHPDLVNIVIKTKIIHTLFETNRHLDIHKLDLFHLQFTNSLTDLLRKIKKSVEQKLLLINNEIQLNNEYITQFSSNEYGDVFKIASNIHSKNMSQQIETLYTMFSNDKTDDFNWDSINNFEQTYANEYYREIIESDYLHLLACNKPNTYTNIYSVFEKKLLGKLNVQHFRIRFVCGLKYQSNKIDVFKFLNSDDKFLYYYNNNAFYLFDEPLLENIDISKNKSNRQQIIDNLNDKNTALEQKINNLKTSLQPEVLEVLKSYLDKISSISFMEELSNVDEQTNILKAMLNVKIQ